MATVTSDFEGEYIDVSNCALVCLAAAFWAITIISVVYT